MTKKYVWLNLTTGEFSNSWDYETHGYEKVPSLAPDELAKDASNGWKLIEYTCVSDEEFEFSNLMKLR